MIRPSNGSLKVYLYSEPVDMRKQIDGLSAIVDAEFTVSPFSKSLFVFVNKRKDKLKILYWEKNGFVIWQKRLEDNRFHWPKPGEQPMCSVRDLNLLLDGYDIFKFKPHTPLNLINSVT